MPDTMWDALPRPILALAPMAGVTDTAFRRLFAKYGKPHVMFTEFMSTAGLTSPGREKLMSGLWYDESERPLVAQIWGHEPADFEEVARLCVDLGFDGIDINTGCPDKNVEKSGGGCAHFRDPAKLQRIVAATVRGAGALPVSIKTRLGYGQNIIGEWLPALLDTGPAAVTIHLRTRQEMSKVPAHWELGAELMAIADRHGHRCPILGNGDVGSVRQARALCRLTGMDGVMVGRGIFGAPWFFAEDADIRVADRLHIMREHVDLFWEIFGHERSFDIMKKHFKAYVSDFPQAKELRVELMETQHPEQIHAITEAFLAEAPAEVLQQPVRPCEPHIPFLDAVPST